MENAGKSSNLKLKLRVFLTAFTERCQGGCVFEMVVNMIIVLSNFQPWHFPPTYSGGRLARATLSTIASFTSSYWDAGRFSCDCSVIIIIRHASN